MRVKFLLKSHIINYNYLLNTTINNITMTFQRLNRRSFSSMSTHSNLRSKRRSYIVLFIVVFIQIYQNSLTVF